jgi:hypothetical protein
VRTSPAVFIITEVAGNYSFRCNFIKIKANISEAQEHMKEAHRKGPEITHRYEMRSRKRRMLVDHNKAIMDEEQRLKERGKKQVLIKPKVEADEGINDSP